jgi:hypothetical protein
MADNREQFTTEIYVNQEQANDAMGKLRDKVDQTAKAYEKLLNTKDADTAKTEKARKAWEAAKSSLENVEKGVAEYGKALKNLSGQSMNNLLKMQQKINAELKKTKPDTAEWKKLANEYAQVTNRIKDLRKAQDDIVSRSSGLKGALERVSAAGNKFGLAIMAIPTAIKSITAAFSGVISVTKQVVNASQTLGDKWNNGMEAMKTTTEAFFFSLSTGDWSAFENGIASVLKKARQLAETMDQLGSYNIAEGYMQSKYLTDYQTNITTATDTEADAEARRKALDAARSDLDAYNEFIQGKAKTTYKALQEEFDVYLGKTFESQEEFDQFFDKLFRETTVGTNEAVNEANAYMQEQYSNYAKQYQVMGDQIVYTYTSTEARALATADAVRKYGQETIDLARAAELNDEKHKALIDTYSQYRNSVNLFEQREKQYNRTRDRVNKQLDETTKKTGGATKATDDYTEAIKRVDKAQSAQILIWKQQYAAGLIDKQLYEARIAEVEEDFLKQKMATAEKYGKDMDTFMSQLLDRQIARMQKAKELLKEEMGEMERYARQFDYAPSTREANGISDPKAYQDFQEKIWAKAAEIRAAITEDSARTEYETEMKWAQKLAEQKKITAEEAEKYILQAKLKYAQAAAQQVSQIMEAASNFVNSLKESETAKLEAEYQAQLTAAGDNAEERERIEAEYEQKKLDLQKKYADTEMVINIAKAVAAGALAAIEAYAAAGNPILGAVFAAIIAATTALEVATIVQQRNAIKNASAGGGGGGGSVKTGERKVTGYAEGGYTEDHTTLTTVGERGTEWVAPHWMLQKDPVTFANLERYRKAGSHGRSGSMKRGFADGGYTNASYGPSAMAAQATLDVDWQAMRDFNEIMRYCAENGLFVKYGDILIAKEKLNNFKSQTSR